MQNADFIRQIELKFAVLNPVLDERVRRQWAAAEAMAYGWGGVTAVSRATGLSIDTIRKGIAELSLRDTDPDTPIEARLRGRGGGRQRRDEQDPELVAVLERLVDPATRGDPESPLRWTCKGTRRLAEEMTQAGHPVGAHGGGAAQETGVQPARQSQDERGNAASRPRCTVRVHQYDGQAV